MKIRKNNQSRFNLLSFEQKTKTKEKREIIIEFDIISNKKTFLYLKALERAEGPLREELLEWFSQREVNDPQKKIERVCEIFTETGAKQATNEKMLEYYHLAINALNETSMLEEHKNQFEELAGFLTERIV